MNTPDPSRPDPTRPDPARPDPEVDPAKSRFIVMQLMRLGGVLFIIAAVMIISGRISGPPELAYGLLFFGAIEFFAMPYLLAQRWKSPEE